MAALPCWIASSWSPVVCRRFLGDVRDRTCFDVLFAAHGISAVLHFAGLKAAGESVIQPLIYYDNNVVGTNTLLGAMAAAKVRTIVHASQI